MQVGQLHRSFVILLAALLLSSPAANFSFQGIEAERGRVNRGVANESDSGATGEADAVAAAKAKLLAQVKRPTIHDVLAAFGNDLPAKNPFQPVGSDPRIEKLNSLAPEMIVQLEFAFPGAVWSPLGRDSGAVGDILEAYYESQGMHDRVVRLDASTASFKRPGLELKFLHSAGLLPTPDAEAERKFVILDPTSWGVDNAGQPTSQIRKLLSVYYRKHGGFRSLDMVNAVGLGTSGRGEAQGIRLSPTTSISKFWQAMKFSPSEPTKILYTYSDFAYLNLRANEPEISWHGSFLEFVEKPDGSVYAPPGAASSPERREHTLWMSYEILKTVRSPEFHKLVEAKAGTYGFSMERVLKTDFKTLENRKKFLAFARERRWSEREIETWSRETFRDLPSATNTLAKLRELDLYAVGVEHGDLPEAVLQEAMKSRLQESEQDKVLADSLMSLLIKENAEGGKKALLATLDSSAVQAEKNGLDALLMTPSAKAGFDQLPKSLANDSSKLIRVKLTGIAEIKSIDGILERMKETLVYAKTPADYLSVLKYHINNPNDLYKQRLESFVLQQLDAFVASGATIDDLKRLEKQAVWNIEPRMALMRKGLKLVTTPEDFIALTKFMIKEPSDAFRHAVSSFVVQNLDTIVKLPGMTIEGLKKLEGSRIYSVEDHGRIMKAGLPSVRSLEDFQALVKFTLKEPSTAYEDLVSRFVADNVDVAIKHGATLSQLKELDKTSINQVEHHMLVMKKGMDLVRTREDFAALTQFTAANPSEKYRNEMDKFIQSHPQYSNHDVKSAAELNQRLGKMKDSSAIQTNLEWGLQFVQTPEDFVDLVKPPAEFDSARRNAYQMFLENDGGKKFMSMNPSRQNLEAVLRPVLGSAAASEIVESLLPLSKSPEAFIAIIQLVVQAGSDGNYVVFLVKKHLSVFTDLRPSNEKIQELNQILRSRFRYELSFLTPASSGREFDATLKKMSLWDRTKSSIMDRFKSKKSCKASLIPGSND